MYIARTLRAAVACAMLPFVVASCGGGGGGNGGGSGGGGAGLSGVMRVATFVIPAGQTQTATSDLTVISTGLIRIDGTLLVAPGVNTAFISGTSITVSGTVMPAPDSTGSRAVGRGRDVPTATTTYAAPLGSYSGTITTGPGVDFNFSGLKGLGVDPRITFSGSITTGNGKDSSTRGVPGGDAGSIEIGTDRAVAAVQAAFPSLDSIFGTPAPAVSATVSGQLTAGHGGHGFDDNNGVTIASATSFTGTNGGKGGSVDISAPEVDVHASPGMSAGDGGAGGLAGAAGLRGSAATHAADGTTFRQPGSDAIALSGNGGDGGSVKLSGAVTNPTGTGYAGAGASAGSVALSAGNGGPGGPGGATFARVGFQGRNGTSPTPNVTRSPFPSVVFTNGGNGKPAPSAPGGAGGSVTVVGSDPAGPLNLPGGVYYSNYAQGAPGSSGCSATPTGGMDGGAGGALSVKGVKYYTFTLVDTSFNGGRAGDGCGPGGVGKGGFDDAGKRVGADGAAGVACTNCGHATVFDSPTFEPINPGDAYTYSYRLYGFASTNVVGNPMPLPDGAGTGSRGPDLVFPITDTSNQNGKASVTATEYENSDTTNGVRQYGEDFYDSAGKVSQTLRYAPPLTIPHGLPLNQPATQAGIVQTNGQPGLNPQTQIFDLRTTLLGFESVTVQAGTYSGCAKVQQEYVQGGTVALTKTMWFAPNVGLVKLTDSAGNETDLTGYTPAASRAARLKPLISPKR